MGFVLRLFGCVTTTFARLPIFISNCTCSDFMGFVNQQQWESLEVWSPRLFLVGFALELVFAVTHGVAYLVEGFTFIDWLYPTVLIGRLAVLVGLAGLSVHIASRNARLGLVSRGIVSAAILFTTGLVILSILQLFEITTQLIAVFGIGTVALTVITFLLYGGIGLTTEAYPAVVGGLLLVAALAVVFVLVGQGAFSTNFRGAVGEGVNAVVFLAIWYRLSTELTATETAETAPGTPAE